LFPILQARHRVTALDLPGFGKSAKSSREDYGLDAQCQRVQQALNALGIEHAHLVGSSMGGAIALWLGKIAPERFSKLAVLAPATDSSLIPNQARYLSSLAPVLRHAVNRRTMKVLLSAVVTKKELITEQVTDAYLQPFLDHGDATAAFWGATALLADPRLPSALAGHTGDIAVIYGEKDRMVSRASIDRLLTLVPRATFITHPDGGHHLMEDEPAWTAKHLEIFFSAPPHDKNA
jgi:pimeloyl-ACP methyl ester carboxylesterase